MILYTVSVVILANIIFGGLLRKHCWRDSKLAVFDYYIERNSCLHIPYTGNIWREEILSNHTGKSYWQGKLANKLQSVHMPNTFLVCL